MRKKLEFQVSAKDHKKRLDEYLFAKIPSISKLYLRDLIKNEGCEVNGEYQNRGYKLRSGDFIEIEIELSERRLTEPEPISIDVVYEDAELIVVNKPAGMLVHPTLGVRRGTLLNALAFHLNDENENADFIRAGLVHRLDRQTSGLMIVAKNARAHRILSDHFKRKLVEKRYFALVEGVIENAEGTIEAPIGRFEEERVWNIKSDGKHAETRFWVKKRNVETTLVELEPVTGRTNQLRIHLAHIGHPIVGDDKYGGREHPRLCLHAYKLEFWHPNGNRSMKFEAPLGDEFGS